VGDVDDAGALARAEPLAARFSTVISDGPLGTAAVAGVGLGAIPFSLAASEDAERVGDGPGFGRVRMLGPFAFVVGHLPLDDAGVAALAARG
jgi:hypothetical protein